MSITKKFLKSKPVCKVTFEMEPDNELQLEKVKLVGEFNQWDTSSEPMKKVKGGSFKETIELETGKEYQFKYLVDDNMWLNDPAADKYVGNAYAGENFVVVT